MISTEVFLAIFGPLTIAVGGLFAYLKITIDSAKKASDTHIADVKTECDEWKALALSLISDRKADNAIIARLTDAVEDLKPSQKAGRRWAGN